MWTESIAAVLRYVNRPGIHAGLAGLVMEFLSLVHEASRLGGLSRHVEKPRERDSSEELSSREPGMNAGPIKKILEFRQKDRPHTLIFPSL